VLLRVQDTGVGIDPVHADNLFDPFYTTKDTGTGLGLPFVQQVVQELRGEIRVRGEQGRGASFDILLPEELVMRGETARPRARYQRG
jgi:signal transduction histidine kinase